ncbi:very short patch repair endonuclease [Microbulbifer taiwanensis]|uniref:Very short patch repair endonuclease n=1 Tax=Microbulbifer taiwanensis TaxID=986746 RepID=A0ABW1YI29_9GAMM
MADTLIKAERSERMGHIRNKHVKPEMRVRRMVRGVGCRYRLHKSNLPGKPVPVLVIAGRKRVVFVHGCFWHRHPDPSCSLARLPKSKLDFWVSKLEVNRQRDEANVRELEQIGWEV